MKLNIEELAREAGFEQIMRHKDGSSTILPTPMFKAFASLIVERCAQEWERINGHDKHGAAAIRNLLED